MAPLFENKAAKYTLIACSFLSIIITILAFLAYVKIMENGKADRVAYNCATSSTEQQSTPQTNCPDADSATEASLPQSLAPHNITPTTAPESGAIDQLRVTPTSLSISGTPLPHPTQAFSASVGSDSLAVFIAPTTTPKPGSINPMSAEQTIFIAQSQQAPNATKTFSVSLESTVRATFSVVSDVPITFTLIDPNGHIIDPSRATADPAVTFNEGPEPLSGRSWMGQYQITHPAAGIWQQVVQTTDTAQFVVFDMIISPVQLVIRTDQDTYRPGDRITVEAALTDMTTFFPGSLISGTLDLLDGTPVALDFYDDGMHGDVTAADGRFTAQTTAANVTGYVTMRINATHGAVSRIATETMSIAALSAQLGGVTSETTSDTDGDHLYDSLNLTISMTTMLSGHFRLTGDLVDAGGQPVASSSASTRLIGAGPLTPGDHATLLAFDGETIRLSGLPGPYTLSDLRLTDETSGTFEVDSATNVYTTRAYQPRQFEGPQLTLLGATEASIDTDGDTLANQLNVQLHLDVIFPGAYAWSGRLLDGQGAEIGWASGAGRLDSQTPLVLSFDGQDIRNHGQNGPYVVTDVAIYQTDGGNAGALFDTAYTTAGYDRLTFDINACIDMHEPDNMNAQAQPLALGETQTHAFCTYDDQDWVSFTADAGISYRIETVNLAPGVDTILELYTGDGQRLLQSNDDRNADRTSPITFIPSVSGTYLVKVHPREPAGDLSFTYDVRIEPLPVPHPR